MRQNVSMLMVSTELRRLDWVPCWIRIQQSTWMMLKPVVTPEPRDWPLAAPPASASVLRLTSRRIMSRVSLSAPMSSSSPGRSSSHLMIIVRMIKNKVK